MEDPENPTPQQEAEYQPPPELAEKVEAISDKIKPYLPVLAQNQKELAVKVQRILQKCAKNRQLRMNGKRVWPCHGCPMWVDGECSLDWLQRKKEEYDGEA